MYFFLTANNYIEHNIQKGFTPNISGTLEHTTQMANIINTARSKQRSSSYHYITGPQECLRRSPSQFDNICS